ncbi:hypothetical protein GQ53DRAFT_887354 [Thozetella sp. PMI_491]|nr:hypothetical protein GQ53DRAFT_887354 [Thozetella sp. PMI_491]
MAEKQAALIQDTLDLIIPATLKLSPDGARVVYSTRLKWNHRKGQRTIASIWIAKTNAEKSAHRLTDGLFNDRLPCWSPDGRSVAFVSDRGVDSCDLRAITPESNEGWITSVEFSPDGKTIAFIAPAEKTSAKRAMDVAGNDAIVWGRDWDYAHLWLLDIERGTIRAVFKADVHVTSVACGHPPDPGCGECPATAQVRKAYHFPGEIWKTYTSGMAVYWAGEDQNYQKVYHGEVDCASDLATAGTKIVVHVEHDLEETPIIEDTALRWY